MTHDKKLWIRLAVAAGLPLTACNVPEGEKPAGAAQETPDVEGVTEEDLEVPGETEAPVQVEFVQLNTAIEDHVLHFELLHMVDGEVELTLEQHGGDRESAVSTTQLHAPGVETRRVSFYMQRGAVEFRLVARWTDAEGNEVENEGRWLSVREDPTILTDSYIQELHSGVTLSPYDVLQTVRACVLKESMGTDAECVDVGELERWDRIEIISYAIDRPLEAGSALVGCDNALEDTDPSSCCYTFSIDVNSPDTLGACDADPAYTYTTDTYTYSDGRSFDARVAIAEAGEGWCDTVSGEANAAVVDHWVRVAQAEHASIASFARFTLELLAHGAPAHLVERAVAAQADEVRHAQLAFELASRAGGVPVGPGALNISGSLHRSSDLEAVVVACIHEGCMGETIAAAVVSEAAQACTDPELAAQLQRVADDEARHAELAWAFVGWVLEAHPELKGAVAAAFTAAPELPSDLQAPAPAWGVLGTEAERRVARRVHHELIQPLAAKVLAHAA